MDYWNDTECLIVRRGWTSIEEVTSNDVESSSLGESLLGELHGLTKQEGDMYRSVTWVYEIHEKAHKFFPFGALSWPI